MNDIIEMKKFSIKGMERVLFMSLFLFCFTITYQKLYSKTKDCPGHEFDSFSFCDMSYKFITTIFPHG